MFAPYRHTQIGLMLRVAAILPVAPLIGLGFIIDNPLPLTLLAAVLVFLALAFSTLTIEVAPGVLSWRFGFGLWRRSVPLAEIASVTAVRNPWWYGWGIHKTPRGWLYNVSGLQAVEIVLKSGSVFRLGTDEAARLARALTPQNTPEPSSSA